MKIVRKLSSYRFTLNSRKALYYQQIFHNIDKMKDRKRLGFKIECYEIMLLFYY